jgi:translation elongation factor EF-1beta
MLYRSLLVGLLSLIATVPLWAQISRDARFEILRTVMADQAAARIAMPFGTSGVDLSDAGEVNKEKVEADIKKNGQSIEVGKVVTVTEIAFGDKQVEIELDGGGKNKKGFLDRLEVGVGTQTRPVSKDDPKKAKGSKVVLKFASKVPADLTPDQLKQLLSPVLDFEKRNFLKTGIDALPPEFQEAVKVKEARIGMDRSTVIMALGRPDKKVREKVDGIDTEDWIYFQRGLRAQFVTFENDVVVRIRQY